MHGPAAAGAMSEPALHGMIEAWLDESGRTMSVQFPPALEARFEQDTRQARCVYLARTSVFGVAIGVVLFAAIRSAVPDVARWSGLLFFVLAMPFSLLAAGVVGRNPHPVVREGLTAFANLVAVVVVIGLFAASRAAFVPYFFSAVTILLIYSSIGLQLRFGYAAVETVLILVAYAVGLDFRQDMPADIRLDLLLVAVATGVYLIIANWRLERELRRNYLVSLRERLQRDALSTRNQELDELARRDPLTGLANRRAYDAWLQVSWQKARAAGERLGLIVIDVDCFKDYNDFYGHSEGDRCLQAVAHCLRDQLRGTSDLVARLGGEEFIALLPGLGPELCADIAERIRGAVEVMELPHLGRGARGLVTVSAGVASLAAEPASGPAALFVAADVALYQAKQTGRNRVCIGTAAPGVTTAAASL